MGDDIVAEFGALDLWIALGDECDVIGDLLRCNGIVQVLDDEVCEVCGFVPAEVTEHRLVGKQYLA